MEEQINAVLFYFAKEEAFEPYAMLWHNFQNKFHRFQIDTVIEEINRLGILQVRTDNKGHKSFMLTYPAKQAILNLPKKYKDNPYGFFLEYRNAPSFPITQPRSILKKISLHTIWVKALAVIIWLLKNVVFQILMVLLGAYLVWKLGWN